MLVLYRSDFPQECIRDCSMPGRDAGPYVEAWLSRIGLALDPDEARAALREYGAWDDDELHDDAANRARILWTACCAFTFERCEEWTA